VDGELFGSAVGCGDRTYLSCREATRMRVRHGGTPTGCPLVSALPPDQVDRVLDLVGDIREATETWTGPDWGQVARASVRGTTQGLAARTRVEHCVTVTGRVDLLRHAESSVQGLLPAEAAPAARDAVTDALAAAVVADVLPIRQYLALTAPLTAPLTATRD
jgi:hypothetical protein